MRQHHPRSPRRSAIRTIFIASVCLAAMAAAHLAWAMPANDDCAGATVIGALPFAASVDTSMATTGVDDQPHTCSGLALDSNTVWYEYVVPASQTLDLDTLGTSYDTVVSVYDGCGAAATELACFFDDTGEETRAPFAASVGSTIYIQISDAGVGGGLLSLGVNDDPAFKIGSLRSTQQGRGHGFTEPDGR